MGRGSLVYAVAWLGLVAAAIANGAVRENTYGRHMSRDASHTLSVAPLVLLVLAWPRLLGRVWPLQGAGQAAKVGLLWLTLTLGFEFGMGRRQGTTWREMLGEYDVRRGKLWPLVPVAVLVAPMLARRRGHVAQDETPVV